MLTYKVHKPHSQGIIFLEPSRQTGAAIIENGHDENEDLLEARAPGHDELHLLALIFSLAERTIYLLQPNGTLEHRFFVAFSLRKFNSLKNFSQGLIELC